MKAMVLTGYNAPLELQDVQTPKPRASEVLVKVHACGSGLTLHHTLTGDSKVALPRIIGHEVTGEVVELGPQAEGLAVGDAVTVFGILFCGRCRFCQTGRESICEASPGMIGRDTDGGYAEFMAVPDANLVKLPAALMERYGPEQSCFVCDAVATPYKVGLKSRLAPNEVCAVIGAAGGVGIHMIDVGHLHGARVIGIDRGPEKLKAIADVGADDGIDALEGDVPGAIRRLTGGRGADVVVDFVGSTETLETGLASLRAGGRLVIVGRTGGAQPVLNAPRMLFHEYEVLGSRGFTRQEIADSLDLVGRGRITPRANHVMSLEQANDAHDLVRAGRNIGRVVLTM